MKARKHFVKAVLVSTIIATLSACSLDGDDGAIGPAATNGAPGADGLPGVNAPTTLNANLIGRAVLNATDPQGGAEIVAFQASKGWVYAVNASVAPAVVEIIDINNMDADALTLDAQGIITNTNIDSAITLDLASDGVIGEANSLAFDNNNSVLAVAVAAETGTRGMVAFYSVTGAAPLFIKTVEVGFLPDNVVFTHDGTKAIVANEGEPARDYSEDPEGSISIIVLTDGVPADDDIELTFESFNDSQAELEAQGAVFANPSGRTINGNAYTASVAKDLEPEYVAVSEDDTLAFVAIQENNALAIVDLSTNTLRNIIGLGFKDWGSLLIDASDKDGGLNFRNYPGLYGMYMPDTIDSYSWNDANFIVSANEGDGREYFFDVADEAACTAAGGLDFDEDDGCLAFIDEIRVEDLTLTANFDYLNNDDNDIGRLLVTTFKGATDNSTDGSGTYNELYTYGARSFTIWDTNGLVVYDSGDDFERITASIFGPQFNNNNDENEGDTRSDAKGPEPEALALGEIDGRNYAFVGLERMGGVMAYDITNPYKVQFVSYFANRGVTEGADITGDLAPEGMSFVHADDSPTGEPLLIIGNEISGSIQIYQIIPE